MFKIALDAGHGKYTAGKRCLKSLDSNETREWVLNDRICDKIEKKLLEYSNYSLIRVDDTTGETDVSLSNRVRLANNFGADLYLSVHQNAGVNGGKGGGAIAIVQLNATEIEKRYQKIIYDELIEKTGLKGNRSAPTPTQNLYVCRETNMPAVLVECGFMDSATDVPIILSESFAENAACALVQAIVKIGKLTKVNQNYNTSIFNDVKGHYTEKHINKLVNYGIIKGYDDNTFRPDNNITRAEFSTLIVNALENVCGYKLNITKVFPDTIGHWAENHIRKLTAVGIVGGYDDGTFKPDNSITRGQAAIMASNTLLYCGVQMKTGNVFPDIIGHYAERHISSLEAYGIINGYDDGTFKPENNITRGQAATIISNCLTVLGK